MELLIKLAALSLCVSAVTALLKKSDEALSLLLLLAAVLVGCAMLLPALSELFDFCERAAAARSRRVPPRAAEEAIALRRSF